MTINQKGYWNNIYSKKDLKLPVYDGWLDRYLAMSEQCK